MKYALATHRDWYDARILEQRKTYHDVPDDSYPVANCGVLVSTTLRYSRTTVKQLRDKAPCKNCAKVK